MSITVTTADCAFNTYVAAPEGKGPWPAVVVIQEIYGVNAVVREVADRLAKNGYLAVAPDLFWRIEPGIDLTDQTDEGNKRAFELFGLFDVDKGVADIAATIGAVRADPRCNGKVGAVGYCLGGLLAYLTAARTDVDAAVGYYGVSIDKRLEEAATMKAPLALHVAGEDQFVDHEAQAKMFEGLGPHSGITLYVYPSRGHAFARPGGANYDQHDAGLADRRTLALLDKALKA